jgi:hypothetical protein
VIARICALPERVMILRRVRPGAWACIVLIAYGALAAIYSLATPMFEAPDENYHYAFIQRLAESWDLPVQDPQTITPWYQEGSQPPLYYLLASLIVRAVNPAPDPYPLAINPHAAVGLGLARDNNNFFIHTPAEDFPWRGHVLALRLVRLFSILLGAWTAWMVYLSARLVCGEVAILALIVAAFNPMFLFVTSSVNNDNLVTASTATAIWLILLIQRREWRWWRVAALSVALALGALSKLSGLTAYAVALPLLAMLWWQRRITFRRASLAVGVLATGFALLSGWWYLRNWQLYGDWTGLNTMIAIIQPRPVPYTLSVMLDEMQGLRISFWSLFGWFNVIGFSWFLQIMDVVVGAALIGGVVRLAWDIRRRQVEALYPLGLLGLHLAITFVSLINWTRQTPGSQGRLLFPALTAICVLLAYGLGGPSRLRRGVGVGIAVILVGVAAASPLMVIAPAYAPPPTVSALPADATRINVQFGLIRALGYRIDPQPVRPGEMLPLTLFYQGDPDPRHLSLYLTALDRDGRVIGKIDGFPGGGNLPTSAFMPGAIYADSYLIPIAANAVAPMRFKIEFGWWQFTTQERLQPLDNGTRPLDALILRGGTLIARESPPLPGVPQVATFGGALRLTGYTLPAATLAPGDVLRVTLHWEAIARLTEDFNVFVHLQDAQGQTVAQGDDAPLSGEYPTSAWAVGEPFADEYLIPTVGVAPGVYRVVVGFYRLGDFSRLPLDVSSSAGGGDSLILNTTITLESR